MRKQNKHRRHNDSRGDRKLRLERLENRRMLAGDASEAGFAVENLSFQSNPSDDIAGAEVRSFQTADAAGSTFATAANLGTVEGTLKKRGSLSWFDRIDLVRFDIAQDSRVRFTLDQLTRDADLAVLDASGRLIGSSSRASTTGEALVGTLRSGQYFLAITAGTYWSSTYRLTLQVDAIKPTVNAPPSTTQRPIDRSSEPQTSPTIRPLSEVAYFGDSNDWNLNAVGAPESWAAGYTGQGITVAVVDTGVDLDHPELTRSLYVNPGEIAGNGIDDDRNGFVDDVSGFDFVTNDAYANDGNGHGTHVAGIIAAANDGRGVTGVAPDAKILPVRVLDDNGSGSDSSVAAGIRYAAEMGADIINLSLGGTASTRITTAIEYAISLGALVVAAAGNESAATPSHPAQHSAQLSGVVSVGAFDSSGQLANFSNRVGNSGAVQIDAPGSRIYSTYAGGGFQTLSGTSMAAPHVAGVAALTLSANPNLTSPQLRQLLSTLTVGESAGSDSVGNISTLYSVAYASAGITQATSRPPLPTSSGTAIKTVTKTVTKTATSPAAQGISSFGALHRSTVQFAATKPSEIKISDLMSANQTSEKQTDQWSDLAEPQNRRVSRRQTQTAAIDAVFSLTEPQQQNPHSFGQPDTSLDGGTVRELALSVIDGLRAA